ncbi:MAG: hypothetical protein L0Z55_11695 [Planctomycetes bacterium]|nr:hypothetical protein [Planctomycetota bacterium]
MLSTRSFPLLPILAAAALAIFGSIAWLARDPETANGPLIVLLLIAAALPAACAARHVRRTPNRDGALRSLFIAGALIRLAFLFHEPYFSDDAYRYLWDGRVQSTGRSPYGIAPADPQLADVESGVAAERRVRARVNHPELPTIYPPVLEVVFHAVALADRVLAPLGLDPLLIWRLFLLAAEMAVAALVAAALKQSGRDPRFVVLYLWHPLPVVESIWSAHAECVAVLLLISGLWLLASNQGARAGIALGLAAAAKLLPAGLLLHVVRRFGAWPAALAAGVITISAIPFLSTDIQRAAAGLRAYSESWYFNDALFHPLGALFGVDVENAAAAETQILRRALYGMMAALALAGGYWIRDPYRAALWVAGVFVLLTPTLHPWYLLWVLPCALACGSRSWLILTVTVLSSYLTVVQAKAGSGDWSVSGWIKACEFLPPLLWLAWERLGAPFGRGAQPRIP